MVAWSVDRHRGHTSLRRACSGGRLRRGCSGGRDCTVGYGRVTHRVAITTRGLTRPGIRTGSEASYPTGYPTGYPNERRLIAAAPSAVLGDASDRRGGVTGRVTRRVVITTRMGYPTGYPTRGGADPARGRRPGRQDCANGDAGGADGRRRGGAAAGRRHDRATEVGRGPRHRRRGRAAAGRRRPRGRGRGRAAALHGRDPVVGVHRPRRRRARAAWLAAHGVGRGARGRSRVGGPRDGTGGR